MTTPPITIGNINITPEGRGSKAEVKVKIGHKSFTVTFKYNSKVTDATVQRDLTESQEKIKLLIELYHLGKSEGKKKFTKEIKLAGTQVTRTYVENSVEKTSTLDLVDEIQTKITKLDTKLKTVDKKSESRAKKRELLENVAHTFFSKIPKTNENNHPVNPPPPPEAASIPPQQTLVTSKRIWLEDDEANYGLPKDTSQTYKMDGKYIPERIKVHEKIIEDFFNNVKPKPASNRAEAVFIFGGPGAITRDQSAQITTDWKIPLYISIDWVMQRLPEFQKGINLGEEDGKTKTLKKAANLCLTESRDVVEKIVKKAILENYPIIIDTTDSNTHDYTRFINDLSKKVPVAIIMADVSTDKIPARLTERADNTGFFVGTAHANKHYPEAKSNFPVNNKKVAASYIYDTSGPNLVPIYTGIKGQKVEYHNENYLRTNHWNRRLGIIEQEDENEEVV